MDLDFNLNLLQHAINQQIEEQKYNYTWDLYKCLYPLMITGQVEFMEYPNYRNKIFPVKTISRSTDKSDEEIQTEMEGIVKKYESGVR